MDWLRLLSAFCIGGGLCILAQLLIDLTMLTPARILVIFVCAGVFLGGIGIYKPLFNFAGAGVSVPLLGFGGNIAKGVMEAVDKYGAIGILKGPFTAAAAGCSAALIFGYSVCLLFNGKPKRT